MDKYVADMLRKGDSFTAVVRKNSVLPHGGEVRVIYDGQVRDCVTVTITNTVSLKRDNIEEIRDVVRKDENPDDVLSDMMPSRKLGGGHVKMVPKQADQPRVYDNLHDHQIQDTPA